MTDQQHIIVGAGQAGGYAAMAMREAGFPGRILLVGDEPHRPYERPPLSKAMLTEEPTPPVAYFHDAAKLIERDITLRPDTTVTAIDPAASRVTLQGGATEPYDRILLATGGRARRLPIPGGETALTLRTLEDAAAIRARLVPGAHVVCIGAGVIGLEIAASARARGCAVTVLESAASPMARSLTPDFSAFIAALHTSAGVDLRCGVTVSAIEGQNVIVDGTPLPADAIIAGIGMTRATTLAEAAGIETDNGILVDETTATSAPGIYAAGDVTAFWHPTFAARLRLEAWRHAMNHGIAAGRAMAAQGGTGQGAPYNDIPWFWTDQHGVNLQLAGLPHLATTTIWRGDRAAPSFAAFHLNQAGHVIGATGINAPREIRAAMALIAKAVPIDPAQLENPAVPLQKIVAGAR